LTDMLSHKREVTYSKLMGWLRCKLSFAIHTSAVMCIRGSRTLFFLTSCRKSLHNFPAVLFLWNTAYSVFVFVIKNFLPYRYVKKQTSIAAM